MTANPSYHCFLPKSSAILHSQSKLPFFSSQVFLNSIHFCPPGWPSPYSSLPRRASHEGEKRQRGPKKGRAGRDLSFSSLLKVVGFVWGVGLYSIHSAILYTCCYKEFTYLACFLSGEWEGPDYLAHGTAVKQWVNPYKAQRAETGTQWANSAGLTITCWAGSFLQALTGNPLQYFRLGKPMDGGAW